MWWIQWCHALTAHPQQVVVVVIQTMKKLTSERDPHRDPLTGIYVLQLLNYWVEPVDVRQGVMMEGTEWKGKKGGEKEMTKMEKKTQRKVN